MRASAHVASAPFVPTVRIALAQGICGPDTTELRFLPPQRSDRFI